jgi:hypothetical protein
MRCNVPDVAFKSTKWRRLLGNLGTVQARDGAGDAVACFITISMAPARFRHKGAFEVARSSLNEALHFTGLSLTEKGQLLKGQAATTL